MATQIKPITGGSWQNIVKAPGGQSVGKNTPGLPMSAGFFLQALRAINEWIVSGGTGTAAVRAQATINATGQQLQDV